MRAQRERSEASMRIVFDLLDIAMPAVREAHAILGRKASKAHQPPRTE